jgi:Lar family restriction alleviation protein
MSQEQQDALKPCPFCGSADIGIWGSESLSGFFVVVCNKCGIGTECVSREEAIATWNRRYPDEKLAIARPTREDLIRQIEVDQETIRTQCAQLAEMESTPPEKPAQEPACTCVNGYASSVCSFHSFPPKKDGQEYVLNTSEICHAMQSIRDALLAKDYDAIEDITHDVIEAFSEFDPSEAHQLSDEEMAALRKSASEPVPIIDKTPSEAARRPKIVCLCGSTRFTGHMLVKQWELTKQGCITLSWCALPEGYFSGDGTHGAEQEGIKEEMDELHKRKIDLADEVLVLNIGGYIGESTRSEIEYAVGHGKPVDYVEKIARRWRCRASWESFTEDQLIDGRCPSCGGPVVEDSENAGDNE